MSERESRSSDWVAVLSLLCIGYLVYAAFIPFLKEILPP